MELVHYSLTVLPSEIPGSGCVTQTQTHNTYTHKQKKMHTYIFYRLNNIVLRSCFVPSDVIKKWTALPKGRDRQRDRLPQGIERNHCHILHCETTIAHLVTVGTAYAVSLFCTPIPRWHLRSLPSTLSGSTPFSFFRPSVSEFWIYDMR